MKNKKNKKIICLFMRNLSMIVRVKETAKGNMIRYGVSKPLCIAFYSEKLSIWRLLKPTKTISEKNCFQRRSPPIAVGFQSV